MRLSVFCLLAAGALISGCADDASMVQPVQLGPQYTDTRQGCQIWDPFPKAGETADWTGPCVGGFAEGRGRKTWKVPNPQPHLGDPATVTSSIYEGTMRHGLQQGDGTLRFYNTVTGKLRSVFTGQWHDDVPEGQGSIVDTPGLRYAGGFHLGRFEGHGTANFADGSTYDGTFHDGHANGSGIVTHPNGLRYEGGMFYGSADGHGVMTMPDGTRYEGDFHLGVPDGQGRLVTSSGQSRALEGDWHSGCLTGSEPFICINSSPRS